MERDAPADPTRRQFFRAFGRQTAASAGTVIGAADALRRGTSAAAGEILGIGLGNPQTNASRMERRVTDDSAADGFSSAYRYTGESLLVLDQRLLPGTRETLALFEPSEVASAMRAGVIGTGPILAEVAAYALVLALSRALERPAQAREHAFGAARDTLLAARPSVHAVRWAVGRMQDTVRRLIAEGAGGQGQLEGLRAEAERIASEAALDNARLGRLGAERLPQAGAVTSVLLHGEMGPLSCGLVGTGFAVVQAAEAMGRTVHVWLSDGGPSLDGGRLSALQLAQLDIAHTVVPDAAVGWLFANRRIDAVLLRGDWVCDNGDSGGPIGGLNVASLATAAGIPVHVCATLPSFDVGGSDGSAIPTELRPAAPRSASGSPGPVRVDPAADVVPAGLVSGYMTERGALTPPFERPAAEGPPIPGGG